MENNQTKFLTGSQVYFRPLEKDDLQQLYIWFNDPEIRGLTGEVLPTSQSGLEEYLVKIQTEHEPGMVWDCAARK